MLFASSQVHRVKDARHLFRRGQCPQRRHNTRDDSNINEGELKDNEPYSSTPEFRGFCFLVARLFQAFANLRESGWEGFGLGLLVYPVQN